MQPALRYGDIPGEKYWSKAITKINLYEYLGNWGKRKEDIGRRRRMSWLLLKVKENNVSQAFGSCVTVLNIITYLARNGKTNLPLALPSLYGLVNMLQEH